MKNITAFLLSFSLLLLSFPALADPPADAGGKRTDIIGKDDWAVSNPISPGTISCPGGDVPEEFVIPYCENSNTGRLHYRDAIFWGCVSAEDPVTDAIDPRMTGIAYYEIWGNWDAAMTGPVGGTWKIVPAAECERLGPFPEDLVANASEYWFGTWTGKRRYEELGDMGFWVGEFRIVGKGYGGSLEGLHFKGEEVVPTYTPFPVPYEFLPPELGLYNVAEGTLTGTITD